MDSPYKNYVVLDFETGGLPSKDKKAFTDIAATELALVIVSDDLQITDQMVVMFKPYKEGLIYDKGAEMASGISRQMVEQQGLDLPIAFKQITDFLKKHKDGKKLPVMVGHNMKFDVPFMINMFDFMKDDLAKYVQPEFEDTIKWSRMCWQESTNYKLGTCCQNAGITLQDAHRSLTDTLATAKLWVYFQKNLRGQGQTVIKNEAKRFRDTFEL